MNFANLFSSMIGSRNSTENEQSNWIKCPKCLALMYYKEVESKCSVCPKCNHHFRINATKREEFLCDKDSFIEKDTTLEPIDPLRFVDKKSYRKRLDEAKAKTGKTSSVVSGSCTINGVKTELVIFDFLLWEEV